MMKVSAGGQEIGTPCRQCHQVGLSAGTSPKVLARAVASFTHTMLLSVGDSFHVPSL